MTLFSSCLTHFDQLNNKDPNTIEHEGHTIAKEQLYAQRMLSQLHHFQPDASEILQLAVYSQHIQRWKKPRQDYPTGRSGYLRWRHELGIFHADIASKVLQQEGYSAADCSRIKSLLQKKNLHNDTEAQCLEDVACLVFIEHYLWDFVQNYSKKTLTNAADSTVKLRRILQKTWQKMSTKARKSALELPLSSDLLILIKDNLGTELI